jgi:hypothetical protein
MDLTPDQAYVGMNTGVLVGIHGSALTNQIWMRPHRGAVVEFMSSGSYHHHNLAAHLGHHYIGVPDTSPAVVAEAVIRAMDYVRRRY